MMADYDIDSQYHPGKVLVQFTQQKELPREIIKLDLMLVQGTDESGQLMTFQIQPTLMDEIKEAQKEDPKLQKSRAQVEAVLRTDVRIHSDGALYFGNKIHSDMFPLPFGYQ